MPFGPVVTGPLSLPRARDKFGSEDASIFKFKSRDALRDQARERRLNPELQQANRWGVATSARPSSASSSKVLKPKPGPPAKPLRLVIRNICAHDLPIADAEGGSDPFARFTLLECDGTVITSCTKALQNDLNPVWSEEVELIVPGGSAPARSKEPLIHIAVVDEDVDEVEEPGEDGDDLLGETALRLTETCGAFFRAPMEGVGLFGGKKQAWLSLISFSYELSEYVPPPTAALLLGGIELFDAPLAPIASYSALSSGACSTTELRPGLRVRFRLPEASGAHGARVIMTPPAPPTTSSFLSWDELTVVLELHDARRENASPLLRVDLWSDALVEGEAPIASGEVRLAVGTVPGEPANTVQLTLTGPEGASRLRLRFDTVEPPAPE